MKKLELQVEDFQLEVHEVSEATVMEEMGASSGNTNCCSVVKTKLQ